MDATDELTTKRCVIPTGNKLCLPRPILVVHANILKTKLVFIIKPVRRVEDQRMMMAASKSEGAYEKCWY